MNSSFLQRIAHLFRIYRATPKGSSKTNGFVLTGQFFRDVFTGRYRQYNKFNLALSLIALIYVVSPIDLITDLLPAGLVDDAAIVIWALSRLNKEIEKYRTYRFKKENKENDTK